MDVRLEVFLTVLVVLGALAQWIAWKFRIPSIILLLACGIALGAYQDPDVLFAEMVGGTASMGPRLLFPLVSLAVGIILFEGGLQLRWSELRHAGRVVFLLCTVGVFIGWCLTTLLAWQLLQLDIRIAALLGSILTVTGPTVIGPMLRHFQPKRHIASILKWEGILIDPIGAVLAVLVFEQLFAGHEASHPAQPMIVVLRVTVRRRITGDRDGLSAERVAAALLDPRLSAWSRLSRRSPGDLRRGECLAERGGTCGGHRPRHSAREF